MKVEKGRNGVRVGLSYNLLRHALCESTRGVVKTFIILLSGYNDGPLNPLHRLQTWEWILRLNSCLLVFISLLISLPSASWDHTLRLKYFSGFINGNSKLSSNSSQHYLFNFPADVKWSLTPVVHSRIISHNSEKSGRNI